MRLALAFLLALSACSSVQVNSDWDPDANFAGLHGWTWQTATPALTGNPRLDDPLVHGRIQSAIRILRERVAKIPNVKTDPAPVIEIQEFTRFGPLLAVRPFCDNAHYWQVYFDTNRVIREAFGEAGFPAPEQLVAYRQSA